MRGIAARRGVGVADGGLLHDILHTIHRERLASLAGCLQPQGYDACCHGRGHRRTLHASIGVRRVAVHTIHAIVGIGIVDVSATCVQVVHGRDDRGTRSRNPRILRAVRTAAGLGIAREIGNVASRVGAGEVVVGAVVVGHLILRHVGTYGDDVGQRGLVAHAHVVGTGFPRIARSTEVVGEVAVAAAPGVDGAAAAGGIEGHGQRVVRLIVSAAVLRRGRRALRGQSARVEHELRLVGGDVVEIGIERAAVVTAQSAHGALAGHGDTGLHAARAAVEHKDLAGQFRDTRGTGPGIGHYTIIIIAGIGVRVAGTAQDTLQRARTGGRT